MKVKQDVQVIALRGRWVLELGSAMRLPTLKENKSWHRSITSHLKLFNVVTSLRRNESLSWRMATESSAHGLKTAERPDT